MKKRWMNILLLSLSAMAQEVPVKQFWYGNKPWSLVTVIYIHDPENRCTADKGCVVSGVTLCRIQQVKILYSVPEWADDQRITMFHELQHVVDDCISSAVPMTYHDAIRHSSGGMVRLLQDRRNRDLVAWLFRTGEH